MLNTGFSIKIRQDGYIVEYFRMNSCTLDSTVIDERGPFETRDEAEAQRRAWHQELRRVLDLNEQSEERFAMWHANRFY